MGDGVCVFGFSLRQQGAAIRVGMLDRLGCPRLRPCYLGSGPFATPRRARSSRHVASFHPVGTLELRFPHDRQARFSAELFERYQRLEKALVVPLAEMSVQGVSTRKVKTVTEELCGHEFSASAVSAATAKLDRRRCPVTRPPSPPGSTIQRMVHEECLGRNTEER